MKKFFVLIGVLCAIQVSAQTVSQQISLKKGEKYNSVNTVEVVITQEAMGQVMEVFMNSKTTNVVDIKDNSSNGFQVSSTLTQYKMEVDAMGNQMVTDSEDPAKAGELKDMLNVPNDYTLDKSGRITSVKMNTPELELSGIGGIGALGSIEAEGNIFSLVMNLPSKAIKVGDTWSDSTDEDGVKYIYNYILKELKNGLANVDITTEVSMNKQMQQQGMDMQMNLTGKGNGQVIFETKTGVINSRTLNVNTNGTVDVMGQQIPMTVETKMITENKKN